jgi:hypothetical protein
MSAERKVPSALLLSLFLYASDRVGDTPARKMEAASATLAQAAYPIIASRRKYFPQSKYCTRESIAGMLLTKRESGVACESSYRSEKRGAVR